jgi:hypothetical protein
VKDLSQPKDPGSDTRHWLFQANPARYRIHDSLVHEAEEWWNLNQHASDVQVGDLVAIWVSGNDAGVYAVGTVVKGPRFTSDSIQGQGYWENANDGTLPKPRVLVRYDRVFVDRPLLKVLLEADPKLWDLPVIRSPRGTNFALSKVEWQALIEWLDESRIDV